MGKTSATSLLVLQIIRFQQSRKFFQKRTFTFIWLHDVIEKSCDISHFGNNIDIQISQTVNQNFMDSSQEKNSCINQR